MLIMADDAVMGLSTGWRLAEAAALTVDPPTLDSPQAGKLEENGSTTANSSPVETGSR